MPIKARVLLMTQKTLIVHFAGLGALIGGMQPSVQSPDSAMAIGARALDRLRRSGELPVVFGIDVEPDPFTFDRRERPPWSGFNRFVEELPGLRERLSEATGAPAVFTWSLRMDAQIAETLGTASWLVETHGEELANFASSGDELGLHTHTWRWDEDAGDWFADYVDEAWAEHCLGLGIEAFESAFERSCPSHRAGDHFLSGAMLKCLADAGVKVDWTVEPGWPPVPLFHSRCRGLLPDFTEIPRHPYYSSPARFPAPDPDGSGPLLMPLFSPPARSDGHRVPLWPDRGNFVPRLALEMLTAPPLVVPLVVRSDAARDRWDLIEANLEHLSRHRGVRFLTAGEAAQRFDGSPRPHESRL